jgi:hypothetical protein
VQWEAIVRPGNCTWPKNVAVQWWCRALSIYQYLYLADSDASKSPPLGSCGTLAWWDHLYSASRQSHLHSPIHRTLPIRFGHAVRQLSQEPDAWSLAPFKYVLRVWLIILRRSAMPLPILVWIYIRILADCIP